MLAEGAILWWSKNKHDGYVEFNHIGTLTPEQVENLKTRRLLNPMFHWIGLCDVNPEYLTIGHNLVGQPIKLVDVKGFGKCYLKVNMTKHDFGKETVTKEIQLIKTKD